MNDTDKNQDDSLVSDNRSDTVIDMESKKSFHKNLFQRFHNKQMRMGVLIGIAIVLIFSAVSLTLTLQQNKKTSDKKIDSSRVVVSPTPIVTPTLIPTVFTTPTTKPIITTIPTASPTPEATPTPAKNSVYGHYSNGKGEDFSLPGQKVTLERTDGSIKYESVAQPRWSFPNIPPGRYRLTTETISGYKVTMMYCYEGEDCYASTLTYGTTRDIEVKNDTPINVSIIFNPE